MCGVTHFFDSSRVRSDPIANHMGHHYSPRLFIDITNEIHNYVHQTTPKCNKYAAIFSTTTTFIYLWYVEVVHALCHIALSFLLLFVFLLLLKPSYFTSFTCRDCPLPCFFLFFVLMDLNRFHRKRTSCECQKRKSGLSTIYKNRL